MNVRIRHVSRERDEELLQWLAWRVKGHSASRIAGHSGRNTGVIVTATNNVRSAGLMESGEDAGKVARAYW